MSESSRSAFQGFENLIWVTCLLKVRRKYSSNVSYLKSSFGSHKIEFSFGDHINSPFGNIKRSGRRTASSHHWKGLRKEQSSERFDPPSKIVVLCSFDRPKSSFRVHKISFGRINESLCSPNEDFGSPNEPLGIPFRMIFQTGVAQIEYSHPLKGLRKYVPNGSFGLPKFSFGEHKVPAS